MPKWITTLALRRIQMGRSSSKLGAVDNNVQTTDKKLGGVTGKGFMPGQSGNPGGRPKKTLDKALEAELAALGADGLTIAHAIAKKLVDKAKAGDVKATQLIAERTQGKPQQKIELDAAYSNPADRMAQLLAIGEAEDSEQVNA